MGGKGCFRPASVRPPSPRCASEGPCCVKWDQGGCRSAWDLRFASSSQTFLSIYTRANQPWLCWGWRLSWGLALPWMRPAAGVTSVPTRALRHGAHGRGCAVGVALTGHGCATARPSLWAVNLECFKIQDLSPEFCYRGDIGEPAREGLLLCVNLSFQKRIRLGLHGRGAGGDETDKGAGSRLFPCPRSGSARRLLPCGWRRGRVWENLQPCPSGSSEEEIGSAPRGAEGEG